MPERQIVELAEWEHRLFEGLVLDDSDRGLVDELAADGRLQIDELRKGVRISAGSWVGVVRLQGLEIRVVPKYAGGDLGVLRMVQYASGLPALARYEALRTLHAEGASLVDLLGWLLADHTERVVRAGLLADYVSREEVLDVLRGRLRLMDQVRRQYARVERLECAYDEHESDILENQILAGALAIARRVCSDELVVSRLSALLGVLEAACDPGSLDTRSAHARLAYNRRNEHYRPAHAIAWLFLARTGIEDIYAGGSIDSFAFLLDMNQLFEDFVTRLLRDALEPAGVTVHSQRRDRSIVENELTSRPYAAIIPDVLLDDRSHGKRLRLPVDAKYKLYDARSLKSPDVYQAFFYAFAYHQADVDSALPWALLVYPSNRAGMAAALRVKRADGRSTARIRAIGTDIPRALEAIEERSIWSLPEVVEVRRVLGHVTDNHGLQLAAPSVTAQRVP